MDVDIQLCVCDCSQNQYFSSSKLLLIITVLLHSLLQYYYTHYYSIIQILFNAVKMQQNIATQLAMQRSELLLQRFINIDGLQLIVINVISCDINNNPITVFIKSN